MSEVACIFCVRFEGGGELKTKKFAINKTRLGCLEVWRMREGFAEPDEKDGQKNQCR